MSGIRIPTSSMNASAGSWTWATYRSLLAANHSRSLLEASSRRNANRSGVKEGASSDTPTSWRDRPIVQERHPDYKSFLYRGFSDLPSGSTDGQPLDGVATADLG